VHQDRWYALSGTDGGEVRLRLAVMPGTLPGTAAAAAAAAASAGRAPPSARRGSAGSRRAAAAARLARRGEAAAAAAAEVGSLLSFFQRSLQGSSRDSFLVEVSGVGVTAPCSYEGVQQGLLSCVGGACRPLVLPWQLATAAARAAR
jgi:hypothetical protein